MFQKLPLAGAVVALGLSIAVGPSTAGEKAAGDGTAEITRITAGEVVVGARRHGHVPESRLAAARFRSSGFDLARVRARELPVPRIYLDAFPRDLARLRSVKARKRLFIQTVLPLILSANEEVAIDRRFLLELRDRRRGGGAMSPAERRRVALLAEAYETEGDDLAALLRRVDIVPPSLALAQAAEESGWGTSRFAQQGKAVFGQRTWRRGRGMVPLRRESGKRHEVVTFNRLRASVVAYVRNLNSHPAYRAFRRVRGAARDRGASLSVADLVATMTRYSERGPDYIRTILAIIRVNRFAAFDRVRLAPKSSVGI